MSKIFICMMALLLGGCSDSADRDATQSRFEDRVGMEVVQVIIHADHVAVAKVTPDENRNPVIDTQQQPLSRDQIETLKSLLLKDEGYYFDQTKKCLFIPTLAFIVGKEQQITVMVSTTCKQIKVITPRKVFILDYDPMAEELNAFCKSVLSES